jgi:hypothetical protein
MFFNFCCNRNIRYFERWVKGFQARNVAAFGLSAAEAGR